MIKQPVMIQIKAFQHYEEMEQDKIGFLSAGTLCPTPFGWELSYQESALTGMEGTTTTFLIEKQRVTLLRTGPVCSQMVFEEGRRHLSMYNTPYGAMAIGVNTHHLLAEVDDKGGDIEIDYAIEVDHAMAGRNIFKINVKEAEGASLKQ